jgi:hypothetical protein
MLIAAAVFGRRRWRFAAALLLFGNVVAYLMYAASQQDEVDQLGIVTKLVELTALGLLLVPHRPTMRAHDRKLRWAGATVALVLVTTFTGAGAWAIVVRDTDAASAESTMSAGGDDHGHHHQGPGGFTGMVEPSFDGPPTPEQEIAAAKLAAETTAGIAKYAEVEVALADGYRPFGSADAVMVHYTNRRFEQDGRILDPTRPETLVYAGSPDGPVLLGAMFSLPGLDRTPPDVGGPLTPWHVHTNVCASPVPPFLIGILTPFGNCPFGSVNIVSNAMIHIWTIDWAGGPYGDMTEDAVKQILADEPGRAYWGGNERVRGKPL